MSVNVPFMPYTFISAMATEAPNKSNTIETVVDVGRPKLLKKSKSNTSAIMTAMKIIKKKKKGGGCGYPKIIKKIKKQHIDNNDRHENNHDFIKIEHGGI